LIEDPEKQIGVGGTKPERDAEFMTWMEDAKRESKKK